MLSPPSGLTVAYSGTGSIGMYSTIANEWILTQSGQPIAKKNAACPQDSNATWEDYDANTPVTVVFKTCRDKTTYEKVQDQLVRFVNLVPPQWLICCK